MLPVFEPVCTVDNVILSGVFSGCFSWVIGFCLLFRVGLFLPIVGRILFGFGYFFRFCSYLSCHFTISFSPLLHAHGSLGEREPKGLHPY